MTAPVAPTAQGPGLVVNRLDRRFAALRAAGRGGLVTYVMAGDPDRETGRRILDGLPGAGADVIELGMPFSDPMADGPTIQAAAQRALAAGQTLRATLDMLADFRRRETETPVVLMGYYNPIHSHGVDRFAADAAAAGADGVIIVDLPPEEASELADPLARHGLHLILLAAPTTDASRLAAILVKAGGFLYYVSITGITGTRAADQTQVADAVARVRERTDLPIAVGFGIRTPEQAAAMARIADAAVVGSAVVERVAAGDDPLVLVRDLAAAVRAARS
ncbi:tryptophan synthase subunit alpha [Roseospira visakhapatnamensis]|uniref:Tryptophan synthase alpha chain n=1 Tax=Roseospira visakhapatnamensis TaxID=390880 RepID=A0A7W6RD38_9PROT|nr:tryptophan synthase subunit alpha [Roseospira visakhapatnamensis]MBB4266366.1 tryptophan synthase alpha chain [Roseospira visakhapatnamensis]